jgi:hypothetical protein
LQKQTNLENRMIKYTLIILFAFFSLHANGQQKREWEQYLYQISEMNDIESDVWESYYDMLCDMEANPININTATREELEQLPFLTAEEVEDISEYLYLHGPMKSLGELAMIENLDYFKRRLLFYFTYAGEVESRTFPSMKNILKYGKHDVMGTVKVPFYTRKGDKDGYEGYQYKHSIRYDFSYGDRVRFGVLGAQDAGEPFFAGKNNLGYDFYSFYFVLKKLGKIKTLALGRYRVRFGMGLVINNNFSFGKLSALSSLGRGGSNIRAHSSLSSGNYLQGAATTVNIVKGLDVSAFVSYRKFDATLNADDGTIATILESGYHRTETELDKKNNSSHVLAGGNVDYSAGGFHVGLTGVYVSLDKRLKPKTEAVYRRHYASGKDFYNIGIDYGYTGHRISFHGETATGGCNAIATINSLSFSLTDNLDLLALQRFYSFRYYSLFAESFSEGGAVQNESGIYLGANWRPIPNLSVMAYSDFAYFAWPKYQASDSSRSFDNLMQMIYVPGGWTFSARYRYKMRERDNAEKSALIFKKEHKGRLSAAYESGVWGGKFQADIAYTDYKKKSFGWMLSQNVSVRLEKLFYAIMSFGYFDTDDYDSRVYAYERGLRYSFYSPAYYGNGVRAALFAVSDFSDKITVTAKVGVTKYFDRDKIGSGYQEIDGSSATDLELQLRLRL